MKITKYGIPRFTDKYKAFSTLTRACKELGVLNEMSVNDVLKALNSIVECDYDDEFDARFKHALNTIFVGMEYSDANGYDYINPQLDSIIKKLEDVERYDIVLNHNFGSLFVESEFNVSGDYVKYSDIEEIISLFKNNQ